MIMTILFNLLLIFLIIVSILCIILPNEKIAKIIAIPFKYLFKNKRVTKLNNLWNVLNFDLYDEVLIKVNLEVKYFKKNLYL